MRAKDWLGIKYFLKIIQKRTLTCELPEHRPPLLLADQDALRIPALLF